MAFSEEIFWAGITSVAKGQWEAARSTGLSFGQTLMNVVLPQAFRLTIPPLTNRTIAITKGTALGTVVGRDRDPGQASSAMSNSYNPSPLMLGAAAYLVLFLPVVVGGPLARDPVRVEAMMPDLLQPRDHRAPPGRSCWRGCGNTVLLSLLVVPLGLLGGLILALLASVRNPWVRWPLMAWVDFFRAFPPLVLLILLFAGLPFAGLELGGFACVGIAFFLNTGAYYGEILRAGIDSVPAGPDRGRALAPASRRLQAMTYVVLPQAVRNVLPDLLSNTLEVVKLTSLGSVVARARAALPGAPGAEPDLQPDAHRGRGDHLLPDAVAAGAAAEPAREPRARRAGVKGLAVRKQGQGGAAPWTPRQGTSPLDPLGGPSGWGGVRAGPAPAGAGKSANALAFPRPRCRPSPHASPHPLG